MVVPVNAAGGGIFRGASDPNPTRWTPDHVNALIAGGGVAKASTGQALRVDVTACKHTYEGAIQDWNALSNHLLGDNAVTYVYLLLASHGSSQDPTISTSLPGSTASAFLLAKVTTSGGEVTEVVSLQQRWPGSKVPTGVEDNADVTDAANVAAAGAVMDSDFSGTALGALIRTGAATYGVLKHNLTATAAPTADDDTADGYSVSSLWIDVTDDNVYLCVDATAAAAVWRQLNGSAGGGAAVDRGLQFVWNSASEIQLEPADTERDGNYSVVCKEQGGSTTTTVEQATVKTVADSVTTAVGGLDSGSWSNDLAYHIYMIADSDGSTNGLIASTQTDPESVTLPSGYTHISALLFTIHAKVTSGDFAKFTSSNNGRTCVLRESIALVTGGTSTTEQSVSVAKYCPPDVRSVEMALNIANTNSAARTLTIRNEDGEDLEGYFVANTAGRAISTRDNRLFAVKTLTDAFRWIWSATPSGPAFDADLVAWHR